ncbi:MAG: DUF1294 domain-containing protein [Eubacteriales bacterium]
MGVLILVYLSAVSLLGFILMGADKKKAAQHQWRIPEKTLFGVALIGGSIGALLGMWVFRHKTKHLTFSIGIPLIIAVQICAAVLIYRNL